MSSPSQHTTAVIALWMKSTAISRRIDVSLGTLHGIGFTEYMVLYHLANAPGNGIRRIDLATAIGRTASGITRMLMPMEKIGLVKREINPRDARVSLVAITPAGETVFRDASSTLDEKSNELLGQVGSKNLGVLVQILDTIAGP